MKAAATAILAIFVMVVFMIAVAPSKPPAPQGTWWANPRGVWMSGGDELIDAKTGNVIAAFSNGSYGPTAWLFECGNGSPRFRTAKESIDAVVRCGEEYEARRKP